jgi:hypothetical protein
VLFAVHQSFGEQITEKRGSLRVVFHVAPDQLADILID